MHLESSWKIGKGSPENHPLQQSVSMICRRSVKTLQKRSNRKRTRKNERIREKQDLGHCWIDGKFSFIFADSSCGGSGKKETCFVLLAAWVNVCGLQPRKDIFASSTCRTQPKLTGFNDLLLVLQISMLGPHTGPEWICESCFLSSGQRCVCHLRLILQENITWPNSLSDQKNNIPVWEI